MMAVCHSTRFVSMNRLLRLAILPAATLWFSAAAEAARFAGPTSSQPLALSADSSLLVAANPDNNTVSFFRVRDGQQNDISQFLGQVGVGDEPWGVAFSPDGNTAYAANTVSGTVTEIRILITRPFLITLRRTVTVGTEPYSLVLTPNGSKLYVANARSNSISVIDTATFRVVRTIPRVGFEPRGMAVSNDGDEDDLDETLYVSQFLSLPVPGKLDGADDAKTARVTVISTANDSIVANAPILPLADTGFKAAGDALQRIAPGPAFTFTTGAYPNQLNSVALHGSFAYLPNTGASPNGPVRFNVNTQSLLSVLDRNTNVDAGQTINMHLAVAQQTNPARRFITQPWSMAFKNNGDEGYVVSAASNIVVKVRVDSATGAPQVQSDPADNTRVLQIPTGRNPRGIVVNHLDTRAFVMNYISRDVTVIDLTGGREEVVATVRSAPQPDPGTFEDAVHIGKELYNTSIGEFDPPSEGAPPITGRMSAAGWGSCSSCHPFGLSDNVVWIFPAGPRRTIPQHGDFDLADPLRAGMRILNWSANRDEQEDFELNIRAVSGGQGLLVLDDGVTQDPNVNDFVPLANVNRNQLKVRGVGAWDAIRTYIQYGVRAPISPANKNDALVKSGEQLFRNARCQTCHGTANWSSSRVRFTPPPDPSLIAGGQILGELKKVGTFNPDTPNEVRQNGAAPLGAGGFVAPSLLSIFAFPQTFLHNGTANSLEEVLNNVQHRSAGTFGVDTLFVPDDRRVLIRFLESIDGNTPPINP